MLKITGILPPLVTPFSGEHVSFTGLRDNLTIYERYGFSGYLLMGSTGEAPLLTETEKIEITESVRDQVPDERIILVGSGRETVSETVELTNKLAEAGANAALVMTPHYYPNSMKQNALIKWFKLVADQSKIPILLYAFPNLTGVKLDVDTVVELSKHENIIGIKDSSGDIFFHQELCQQLAGNFNILTGSAANVAPALMAGASGAILALANFLPEPVMAMWRAFEAGRTDEMFDLQKALLEPLRKIMGAHGIPGIKAAMDARALDGRVPRLPFLPLAEKEFAAILSILEGMEEKVLIPQIHIGLR